jgi:hypothetical protein
MYKPDEALAVAEVDALVGIYVAVIAQVATPR